MKLHYNRILIQIFRLFAHHLRKGLVAGTLLHFYKQLVVYHIVAAISFLYCRDPPSVGCHPSGIAIPATGIHTKTCSVFHPWPHRTLMKCLSNILICFICLLLWHRLRN